MSILLEGATLLTWSLALSMRGTYQSITESITRQIATVLAKRLLKQSELGSMLGISPARVSQILHGDANLTIRSLVRIADVLGLELVIELRDRKRKQP